MSEYNPTMVVVVGIGGSSLGSQAILTALRGYFAHEHEYQVRVYFADTIDSDYIADLGSAIAREFANGGTVILNVVSKSGTTTETIANFATLLEILREYRPANYQHLVVVTTDEGSPLWHYAGDIGYARLAIPPTVGGRFSVFTAAGLLPLALAGIDCSALLHGAQEGMRNALVRDINNNHAALNALLLYALYQQGKTIHDTFIFSTNLSGIGSWYRQLFAESLGKHYESNGQKKLFSMLPTVSIGPNDLHSVAQFYLGGYYPAYTRFIRVEHRPVHMHVPQSVEFEGLVPHIHNKSLDALMNAIADGVQQAYSERELPTSTLVLPEISAHTIGYFLQSAMLEVVYLGLMLDINPFDQPDVVSYKKNTRKILAHEHA